MILRAATPADAPAIARILSDWTRETEWMPRVHSAEEGRGFGVLLIERTAVTVAEDAGRVQGFLARREGQIEALYITPDARGQGVGTALMARAMATCAELGLWCFLANRPARAFYARLGFAENARTDGSGNDEKLPDVHLVWSREAQG